MSRTPGAARAIVHVASRLPPSTTMVSGAPPCASTAASVAGSAFSSSSAGMMIEITDTGGSVRVSSSASPPLAPHPCVIFLHQLEQYLGRVGALPRSRCVFVRLRHGGIDMDGAEDLVETDAVAHGRDVLDDQVARVLPDDRDSQHLVLAGNREHFHHPARFSIHDGAVELVDAVVGSITGDTSFLRFSCSSRYGLA